MALFYSVRRGIDSPRRHRLTRKAADLLPVPRAMRELGKAHIADTRELPGLGTPGIRD